MKLSGVVLAALAVMLPATALAAAAPATAQKTKHMLLHVSSALKHNSHFTNVTGNAALTPLHITDTNIVVTVDNLPSPIVVDHGKYYAVWITDGKAQASIGTLSINGTVATHTSATHWRITAIFVTSERHASSAKPGTVVLSSTAGQLARRPCSSSCA